MRPTTAPNARYAGPFRPLRTADDKALVERAQFGDRAAIVELYQRYVNEIFGYVLNQLGTAEEAEDVTSEIFLRFVNSIDGFHGRSSIRTWLYVIARNLIRDRWRAEGRSPRLVTLDASVAAPRSADDGPTLGGVPGPSDSRGARATSHATRLSRAILQSLPDRYRQVLELRIMEGRSIRDTAEEMATTPGNVKVLQHRALKRAAAIAGELDVPSRPLSAGKPRVLRSEA